MTIAEWGSMIMKCVEVLRGALCARAIAVLATSFIPCGVGARTWHVPSECPTIHAGLDSASYGDTVLVAPGTYLKTDDPETWIHPGPGVCLKSEEGPEVTIIELCSTTLGIDLTGCEGAVVSGFTVRFGSGPGCSPPGPTKGINLFECTDVVVESCVVENVGVGIKVSGLSQSWDKPVIRDNTIRHCSYGVLCWDVWHPGRPRFSGNVITDCGHGVDVENSSPYFDSCEIAHNTWFGMGYHGRCGGNVRSSVIAHNGGSGVEISTDPSGATPGFNGSWLPEEANDFYDNGAWDIWYAHSGDWDLVMAIYNYWGSDCPDFASKIHGRVNYNPWMDSTHTEVFVDEDCQEATEPTTWGSIKSLFR